MTQRSSISEDIGCAAIIVAVILAFTACAITSIICDHLAPPPIKAPQEPGK